MRGTSIRVVKRRQELEEDAVRTLCFLDRLAEFRKLIECAPTPFAHSSSPIRSQSPSNANYIDYLDCKAEHYPPRICKNSRERGAVLFGNASNDTGLTTLLTSHSGIGLQD